MFGIQFTKTKYATKVTRNKSILKFESRNCKCVKQIHQEDGKKTWCIIIEIPEDIINIIKDIDSAAAIHCGENAYLNSVFENKMKVKIPYRYNKYECTFMDDEGRLIVSSDIKEGDLISLEIMCVNLWEIQNERGTLCGLTWQTKLIKKIN